METKYLEQWENEMNICIRCAYCYEGCPVYKELGWESDGARGKVMLAHALLSGKLEPSDYIMDKLYQCTYCRDCVERCSSNVSIPDIITAARADIYEAGFGYDSHRELLDKINATGNIYGQSLQAPQRNGTTPVLLGCRFLERTEDAEKYLAVLEKLGVKPRVVDEVCCGMPFGVLGYKDELADHKEKFKNTFPNEEFICLCTTCAFFIEKSYPELKPKYVIKEIAERLPQFNGEKLGIKAAYHDPCNLARGMNMVDEPRDILKQIGVELVEFPASGKQAECCGGGGGVLVTSKELSEKMAEKRVKQALDLNVDTLVTLCPTCELNLSNMARRNGNSLPVRNVLDLIYDAVV